MLAATPLVIGEQEIFASASVGIALSTSPHDSAADLLHDLRNPAAVTSRVPPASRWSGRRLATALVVAAILAMLALLIRIP